MIKAHTLRLVAKLLEPLKTLHFLRVIIYMIYNKERVGLKSKAALCHTCMGRIYIYIYTLYKRKRNLFADFGPSNDSLSAAQILAYHVNYELIFFLCVHFIVIDVGIRHVAVPV